MKVSWHVRRRRKPVDVEDAVTFACEVAVFGDFRVARSRQELRRRREHCDGAPLPVPVLREEVVRPDVGLCGPQVVNSYLSICGRGLPDQAHGRRDPLFSTIHIHAVHLARVDFIVNRQMSPRIGLRRIDRRRVNSHADPKPLPQRLLVGPRPDEELILARKGTRDNRIVSQGPHLLVNHAGREVDGAGVIRIRTRRLEEVFVQLFPARTTA